MDSTRTNDQNPRPRRIARRWMPSRDYPKPWLVTLTERQRKAIYLLTFPSVRRPR